jgi:hypothetical protein
MRSSAGATRVRVAVVVGLLALAWTAGAAIPGLAAPSIEARLEPIPGHLVLPGERLLISYTVDGIRSPAGSLYVRNNLMGKFEGLPLKLKGGSALQSVIPARLIRGQRLLYYAVVRDPSTGRSVKVPAAGARHPDFAFVLEKPVLVQLGAHVFGHTRTADAVVARASADEVGWQLPPPGEGPPFGPQTFVVAQDRSIWLSDGLNQRLLVWEPDRPDTIARTVNLPFFTADSDIALGPADTFYALRGLPPPNPRVVLERESSTGEVWQSELAGAISSQTGDQAINSALRTGPNGSLYEVLGRPGSAGGERGWRPVATSAGDPLSIAAQRRGDLWPYQPVAGGLRFLAQVYTAKVDAAPHEARFALIDNRNLVVRAWRVLSKTDVNLNQATPEVVDGEPVVVLDVTAGTAQGFEWEYLVLRLGPHGTTARFALSRVVFGDNILADVRVGPDGNLYQLASSPTDGVTISRYSLAPIPVTARAAHRGAAIEPA